MTEKSEVSVSEDPTSDPAAVETFFDLADVVDDAHALSEGEFAARYGDVFLMHYGSLGPLTQAERRSQTRYLEGGSRPAPSPGARRSFLVFPVRATGRSPSPSCISVGRVRNNDVIIEEASLSKLHAYLHRGDDGTYAIQDAGSTNGTKVDALPVPVRDQGAPVPLRAGSSLQLGGVRVSFVNAAQVRELARRLGG